MPDARQRGEVEGRRPVAVAYEDVATGVKALRRAGGALPEDLDVVEAERQVGVGLEDVDLPLELAGVGEQVVAVEQGDVPPAAGPEVGDVVDAPRDPGAAGRVADRRSRFLVPPPAASVAE